MSEFDPFAEEWVSYAKNPRYSLMEKCLKISKVLEFPDLEIPRYLEKLDSFGKHLRNSVPEKKNPTYLISMLNEYMFDRIGFEGNYDDYYNPRNNFLNVVVDTKRGIPITLSIIYMHLGNYLGLDLRPVGFPGHFLVKYSEEIILDPFNGGMRMELEDLEDVLNNTYGDGVQFNPDFLNDIDTGKIIIRIARNLKNSYMQSFNYGMAMHCANMVLGLAPDDAEETRDKGILQSRMLQDGLAIKSLERYLELSPEANDVDEILELIRSMREKSNQ